MKLPSAATGLFLGTAAATPLSLRSSTLNYNMAPPNLSTLPNNSLYETWRPRAHVLPPNGQIGDPCMHYTDPATGVFHVGWLHDSAGIAGATTSDLATYTDLNPNGGQAIVPGGINDPVGVFDGSVIPSGINGLPTLLYTSVSYLPIHWSIPYTRGSETQSLAVTTDSGRNFTKLDQGPVIPGPPFAANVTAFRDPYVFQNTQLDTLTSSQSNTWYTVISGGIHNQGPTQFLYRQYDPDFQYWEYLGQWWSEPTNSTWGDGTWAGRWGFNFETGNVFSLNEEGYTADGEIFGTLGTEGSDLPIVKQLTSIHDQLWVAGSVAKNTNGSVEFTPSMAGFLDWGFSSYAASGKVLPATSKPSTQSGAPDRYISYVWLTGDQYGQAEGFPTNQQNWTGALLLPRELKVQSLDVVDNALSREEGASWRVESNNTDAGTVELRTLGISIARETEAKLLSGKPSVEAGRTVSSAGVLPFQHSPESKFFVLKTNISFPASARQSGLQTGFQILASESEHTSIYYQFANESVVIDRSNTSAAAQTTSGIDSFTESGKLRLFDVLDGGEESVETLDLTIVVDNSILEVYANGRFALSTWVRSWYANSTEIRFLHNGVGQATFSNVTVSEGLYNAWPERA
ncbi:extracellular invertase [Aspergillus ellipticus CBS 707.79]|uniref:Extracellular invertase n=1 Tax=Aspergillus ellipticus CBS 707.79 TaxID=1448320 RepID=A0A319CUK6_9EURO|nr:extracellular invertase [Aspergillus ellipticus CBS 707.79]